jgi:hypothetical protein
MRLCRINQLVYKNNCNNIEILLFFKMLQQTKRPCYAATIEDGVDQFEKDYAPWPLRFYVLQRDVCKNHHIHNHQCLLTYLYIIVLKAC